MKASASIVLYYKDIADVLFNYYFGDRDLSTKIQIEKTGKMLCKKKIEKGLVKTKKHLDFILTYERSIKSLGHSMREKIDVSLKELCDIINEKISDQGYEIDNVDDTWIYGFGENSSDRLNFLTLDLKKKEDIKVKTKGCRKK